MFDDESPDDVGDVASVIDAGVVFADEREFKIFQHAGHSHGFSGELLERVFDVDPMCVDGVGGWEMMLL